MSRSSFDVVSAFFGVEDADSERMTNKFLQIPEKALLVEVLRQAVRDIIHLNQGKRCAQASFRRLAIAWLESDIKTSDQDKFTFVQVCDELDLDPVFVRRKIFEAVVDPLRAKGFERRSQNDSEKYYRSYRVTSSAPRKKGRQAA